MLIAEQPTAALPSDEEFFRRGGHARRAGACHRDVARIVCEPKPCVALAYVRRVALALMNRGDAAAATRIVRGDGSRRGHGHSFDESRGDAAAATWIVRRDWRTPQVLQLQLLLRVRRRAVRVAEPKSSTGYPRRGRGAAATPLRGISTSQVRFALRAVHVVLPSQGLGHRVFMLQDAAAALRQRPLLGPTHRRRGVRGGSHALALRGRPVRGPRWPVARREPEPLLVVGRVGLRSVDGRPVPRAGRGPLK